LDVSDFDLRALSPGFYDDPFPFYRALRERHPVRRMPDGSYFLTRYADVEQVYKDPKRFSSDKKREFKPKYGDSPLYEHHTTSLVFNDPPLHTRVRRLIAGALTPRAIAEMEPGLVSLVDVLLNKIQDRKNSKTPVDLIEDFAAAIPVEIIGNLLGVPHEERGPLREWSLAILGALEPVVTAPAAERGNRAVTDRQRDVLTRLIEGEADGEQLTAPELIHNCIFLLNAGHETTTNLIGNGLVTLARNPAEKEKLRKHPELAKSAVEEVLRYESSNQLGNRSTTEPVRLGGVELPAQALITVCIGAANRDPAQFPDPDRFDIARSPNRHLAFASGIHVCAGASLARLEGQVALSRFLARFPDYEIGEVKRGGRARFRGFLKVACTVN
jgi:cytochrome P450